MVVIIMITVLCDMTSSAVHPGLKGYLCHVFFLKSKETKSMFLKTARIYLAKMKAQQDMLATKETVGR
jgi:hypothetical protein